MNWQDDPSLNWNFNFLKDTSGQLYDAGRANTLTGMNTAGTGSDIAKQSLSDLSPVMNYFRTGATGDTAALSKQQQPQLDAIGNQFQNVRNMISSQPRGGGTASQLAQAPIAQIGDISQLLSTARNNAVQGVAQTAGQEGQLGLGIGNLGLGEAGVGMGQTGQGIGAQEGAAQIAGQGRALDVQNSWKSFFKQLANTAVSGLTGGVAKGITGMIGGGGGGGSYPNAPVVTSD